MEDEKNIYTIIFFIFRQPKSGSISKDVDDLFVEWLKFLGQLHVAGCGPIERDRWN
jgi:hypothetical protein